MENENLTKVDNMAKEMNFKEHAKILNIPLYNGFEKIEDDNPQTVFITSSNNGIMYQVVSDGKMNEKETINVRINFTIEKTLKFMKDQGFEVDDSTYFYYKDFDSDNFGYKIYIQDIIIPSINKVLRNFNAFFIEPKFKDFYQVSMSVGPFNYPTQQLKCGVVDLENDSITKNVYQLFEYLLTDICYKDEE